MTKRVRYPSSTEVHDHNTYAGRPFSIIRSSLQFTLHIGRLTMEPTLLPFTSETLLYDTQVALSGCCPSRFQPAAILRQYLLIVIIKHAHTNN